MKINYPTRCRIIDVNDTPGLRTPDESKPHIGKEGLAELVDDGENVRITLDDGTEIHGYKCWWEPIK